MRFDRSLLPPARLFYEAEMGELARQDRRGWVRASCPFHKSRSRRSFGVNLNGGRFNCFACGAGGDIAAFVMRKYNLNFRAALLHLGIAADSIPLRKKEAPKRPLRRLAEAVVEGPQPDPAKAERVRLRDWLHALDRIHRDVAVSLERSTEDDLSWGLLSVSWELIREAERDYMQLSGLEAR